MHSPWELISIWIHLFCWIGFFFSSNHGCSFSHSIFECKIFFFFGNCTALGRLKQCYVGRSITNWKQFVFCTHSFVIKTPWPYHRMFCVYWIKISFYLLLFLWPLNWKQNIRIICIGEVIEGHPTSTYRLLWSWPGKIIINFLLVNIHSSVVVHWGTYYSVFLLSLDSRGMTWKSGWPVDNSVLFLLQERSDSWNQIYRK